MRFRVGADPDVLERCGHAREIDEEVVRTDVPAGRGSGVPCGDEDPVHSRLGEAIDDLRELGSAVDHPRGQVRLARNPGLGAARPWTAWHQVSAPVDT